MRMTEIVNGLNAMHISQSTPTVEVYLIKNLSEQEQQSINASLIDWLCGRSLPLSVPVDAFDSQMLREHIEKLLIQVPEHSGPLSVISFTPENHPQIIFTKLDSGEQAEEIDDDGECWAERHTLPSRKLDGQYESLSYPDGIKERLLKLTLTALELSSRGVDQKTLALSRLIILHGLPGSGKSTLCRALSHKIAVRAGCRASLTVIDATAIFSKWFSESAKRVRKLFDSLEEQAKTPGLLVFVVIDEVESLAMSRNAGLNGTEPSDAFRAVNAVLTRVDRLREFPNVFVFATTNCINALDSAFIDRADVLVELPLPPVKAIYSILRDQCVELMRSKILEKKQLVSWEASVLTEAGRSLRRVAAKLSGASGRKVRKLPLLVLTELGLGASLSDYLRKCEELMKNES